MKSLKPEKRIILNLAILLIILLPFTFILITPGYKVFNVNSIIEESQINANQPYLADHQIKVSNWDELTYRFDRNDNRIDDKFESKLNSIVASNSKIRLIIQFPDNYDYSNALNLFENNGGKVKYSYKYAINGFSGTINYRSFLKFYGHLKNEDIQFIINENSEVRANLYYTSRSMNTRPYVWNTLGYDGDNKSAIAILDTGIDESSEFFDNYSLGDYNYKIVGWRDFVAGGDNSTAGVRDNNGHGSHCAGIAAGLGTPVLDSQGRLVTTSNDIYKLSQKDHGDSGGYIAARFNVTAPGDVSVLVNFTDLDATDDTFGIAYLLHKDSGISAGSFVSTNWWTNLTLTATAATLGAYEVIIELYYDDNNGDLKVTPNVAFRAECHFYFNPDPLGCGNYWKGVAPDAHLVGVKVMGDNGVGSSDDIIRGIEWVIQQRDILNITIMSLSLGGASLSAEIDAVDKAMRDYGIVTVVSAGNSGPGGNYVGSPGDADYVITVAAMNTKDQIALYSSQGGSSYYGNTIKPDITAPGGSAYDLQIISADSNDNDCEGLAGYTDSFINDTKPAQGTSMAAPAVAGAASLLIEAMRKDGDWDWDSGSNSTLVKSLLLMTATETYPLQREYLTDYSPTLNRGGKDVHEGYGRINIDAAIEAWTFNLTTNVTNNELLKADLKSSYTNSFAKHATAGFVNLQKGQSYCFNLSVPSGIDYDMHLYNSTPAPYGEPDLIWSRTSSVKGKDEFNNYTAEADGKYFLVIKAIGPDLPAAAEEDDDDNGDDDDEVWDIIEFLLSPLGLLLVVGVGAAVIILIVYAARGKREEYTYIPDYSY